MQSQGLKRKPERS